MQNDNVKFKIKNAKSEARNPKYETINHQGSWVGQYIGVSI